MSDSFALILIHGHGVDATIWNGIYAGLSSDIRIVRPDFSRLTNHDTIEAYAEELYAQLEPLAIQKAIVVGHSMGGYIALAFGERYPEMTHGLGLFHSTALADDEPKKEQRQQIIAKLEQAGTRSFLETAITNMFAPDNREKMADTIQQLIDRNSSIPPEALQAGIRAMLARPDRTHVLKQATYPVLIVAGKEDQIVPFEKSQSLFQMAPNTQAIVLEQSGHLGMIEQPDEALRAIQQFVVRE